MAAQVAAIIPAAGFGTRMQLDHPKQYHKLAGVPILVRTLIPFLQHPDVIEIVVAVPTEFISQTHDLLSQNHLDLSRVSIISGGKRRQDSVYNGLLALNSDADLVLVHDGARPLVTEELITSCCQGAVEYGAGIAAVPVKDTLKKAGSDTMIGRTVDRTDLYHAQTPQVARKELLLEAYSLNGDADVTDEASLLEKANFLVKLVEGSETNIKITRPEDLVLAEKLLTTSTTPVIKIGHGYDAHRFQKGRKLVLGGVTIEHSHGLAGHSDADVLTHALCDAILGALGRGDIGKHFPDTDSTFKDVYSITLLEKVVEFSLNNGYRLSNADITVVCQAPKLSPKIPEMKKTLSKACAVGEKDINIKATTTEKMGFTGREEGISSHAVVLLQAIN